jgi:Xaa-Pro aminopeptidase
LFPEVFNSPFKDSAVMSFDLARVQSALKQFGLDGWLLFDFRGSNVLARRVLGLEHAPVQSRRFAYCIPAVGSPRKLAHRIEPGSLDHLPGEKTVYLSWQQFESGLATLTSGLKTVAMEYSPRNPYVSKVDAGTVEAVRATGCTVVPSGDLIQVFEATWDDEQWAMHLEAARWTDAAFPRVWKFIADAVRANRHVTERMVADEIMRHFGEHGMTTYHPPIVGVGPHSGDPHYEFGDTPIEAGSFVLVDLWAKLDKPRAVYSDLTRVACVGETVPEKYEHLFQIVAAARDAAIARVKDAFAKNEPIQGKDVDAAGRAVIVAAGFGEAFVHRIGHSIGQETHGNGANMDSLEVPEDRRVLPGTCFSIEPGIYLPEFGVRSEVNVFVDSKGTVHVTGGELQRSVVPILAEF